MLVKKLYEGNIKTTSKEVMLTPTLKAKSTHNFENGTSHNAKTINVSIVMIKSSSPPPDYYMEDINFEIENKFIDAAWKIYWL